VVLIPLNWIT